MPWCPWSAVFGDDHPVEIEIGPGRGDVLLAFAADRRDTNFFAIEQVAGAAEAIAVAARARGLGNVRVVAADARCVLGRLVADSSVTVYHIYFPDPWPKTRHRGRRLASDPFARDVARTLVPGGVAHVASDLAPLVADFVACLERAGLRRASGVSAPPDRPRTAFERRYAGDGTCYARLFRPL